MPFALSLPCLARKQLLLGRLLLACAWLAAAPAGAQGWPDVFEPTQLLTLNLTMSGNDWNTVQNDSSLSIEVPATFWADGETPITISVRRKSATALTAAGGYKKVSLRLDINEFVVGQSWNGLKKLSLENGDDNNVLSEGFGWQVHRLANGTLGYGYQAALASWVRVIINGVDTGVYVNPEFRDKKFLENRGVYVEGETWLYEVEAKNTAEIVLQVGPVQPSPATDALCYDPFAASGPTCPAPDLATHVPQWVDINGLLSLLASDAFTVNPDATLTNGKNFYFADFSYGPKRMYFPWDLDSAAAQSPTKSIYSPTRRGSDYSVLLDSTAFRAQYSQIVNDLVCGPWSVASLTGLLDAVEPALVAAVDADPNSQIEGSAADYFDGLRAWATTRVNHVIGELEGFQPCPTVQLRVNEVMAANATVLEDPDEPGEYPDWFEIYNPAGVAVDIGGTYVTDDLAVPTKYQIPAGVTVPAQGYLLMYADDDGTQGPLHTNFKLSASGESVALFDTDGVTLLDSISFGPQPTDVALARFPDGAGPWDFVPVPTPGSGNGPHNPPPVITSTQRALAVPSALDAVSVSADVSDDSLVASVTLSYDAGAGAVQVAMADDGLSGDGAAGDGVYGAEIPGFASDTIVDYWISATDDLGGVTLDPPPAPAVTFTYVVDYSPPPLAINEYMADNDSVIEDPDEPLAFEDWIELYNAGAQPQSLDGMYLSDDLLSPTKYALPSGLVVPAGGHLLLWADFEPAQGPTHLGFQLAAAGEEIGLFDTDARGNVPIDTLAFGPQTTDLSEGRCPDGLAVVESFTSASPGLPNLGAAACPSGSIQIFAGSAEGGEVRITIDGVLVTVATFAGQSVEQVVEALAAAVNADPVLAAAGTTASGLGAQLATNGTIDSLLVTDPGLSTTSTGPTFSIDFQGPSQLTIGGFGFTLDEGSILTPSLAGPTGPAPPGPGPVPRPGMMVDAAAGSAAGSVPGGLGLVAPHEIDALSYGRDTPTGSNIALVFSVDEFASGQAAGPFAPPTLLSEGALFSAEASADVFAYPRPLVATAPVPVGSGVNVGVWDGDGVSAPALAGVGLVEPNLAAIGIPDAGDNLDALDADTLLADLMGPVYFSLDGSFADPLEPGANLGSAAAQPGAFVGGDVLVSSVGAPGPSVAIPAAALGLDLAGADTDDLDALAWNDADGSGTLTAPDTLYFSVRRGSAVIGSADSCLGIAIEEGDILTPPAAPATTPCIHIAAEAMGLGTVRSATPNVSGLGDDVDAIDLPEPSAVAQLLAGAGLLLMLAGRRRGRCRAARVGARRS